MERTSHTPRKRDPEEVVFSDFGVHCLYPCPLAKAGGSKCKLRGIPTLGTRVERAERSGGLHKRSAEDWGDGLYAREGGALLGSS